MHARDRRREVREAAREFVAAEAELLEARQPPQHGAQNPHAEIGQPIAREVEVAEGRHGAQRGREGLRRAAGRDRAAAEVQGFELRQAQEQRRERRRAGCAEGVSSEVEGAEGGGMPVEGVAERRHVRCREANRTRRKVA